MKIAIDIRRMTEFGVGTYIRNVVRTLGRLDRENKYLLIGPPAKVLEIGPLPPNFHTVPLAGPERSLKSFREFRAIVKRIECDLDFEAPAGAWIDATLDQISQTAGEAEVADTSVIHVDFARPMAEPADESWTRDVFSIALVPTAIFYLKADLEHLVPRVAFNRGFDYWESGMDMGLGRDMYESFTRYQTRLLEIFDRMAPFYGFNIVDANGDTEEVFEALRRRTRRLLDK